MASLTLLKELCTKLKPEGTVILAAEFGYISYTFSRATYRHFYIQNAQIILLNGCTISHFF